MKKILLPFIVFLFVIGLMSIFLINRTDKPKTKNILLISIDTCRTDYLGCYGSKLGATPNIDSFAEKNIVFENAFTTVPITLPAHASLFTGKYPLGHNIHDNLGYILADENLTIAEILKENGYHTTAFISSFVLDAMFGIGQGFDEYNDKFEKVITTSNYSERYADEVTEKAIDWLNDQGDKPWFLFLHYYDPHFRYEPPEPYRTKFKDDLYAGEIAYVDNCIGKILSKLKETGSYDSTLIILTADHGEMLGEHGEAEHGYFIYNSAVSIPLILKDFGDTKPQRIKSAVSITDIMPTICELTQIDTPKGIHGKSLINNIENNSDQRYLFCESYMPTKHGANTLLGLINGKWKYIQTTDPELYNIETDPKENKNLINKEAKRAHLLKENLKELIRTSKTKSTKNQIELDEKQRAKLASLGYIGSVEVDKDMAFNSKKPDPKEYIKYHNIKAYNDMAIGLVQKGKYEQAITSYKKLIDHYKHSQVQHSMAKIYFNLGIALQKNKQNEESKKYFEMAAIEIQKEIDMNSDSYYKAELYGFLGDTYASISDFESASNSFRKSIELNPNNPQQHYNLVSSLRLQNKIDQAGGTLINAINYFNENGNQKAVEYLKQLKTGN